MAQLESREMDLAKAALELAETAANRANTNVERAQAVVDDAQQALNRASQFFSRASQDLAAAKKEDTDAKNDLNNAKETMKAVEAKWELIEVGDAEEDDDGKVGSGSAEAPVAASGEPEPVAQSNSANDGAENGSEKKRAAVPTGQSGSANKKARSDVDIFQVKSIEVSGCGTPEVNGTYVKTGMCNGAPEFRRSGKWMGQDITFFLLRSSQRNHWFIGGGFLQLYKCRIEDDNDISPFNKVCELYYFYYYPEDDNGINPINQVWKPFLAGVAPPPKLEVNEFL
jgi:hypothetical protein